MVAYSMDNLAKNMLLATYDGEVWMPVLYDLDTTWGIDWDGKRVALLDSSRDALLQGCGNLAQKLFRNFPEELLARYCELRSGILSNEHIREQFEAFTGAIPQGCYDMDHRMWNPDGELIRTIDSVYELMDTYLPDMDAYFGFDAQAVGQ